MARQPVGTPFEGETIITGCEQQKSLKETWQGNMILNAGSVNIRPVGTPFQKTSIVTRQEYKSSVKVTLKP